MEKAEKIVMKHRDRLERNATKSELRFMQFLINRKTPFQFQKMLRGASGNWYIADFYIHEFRLVIEIDGAFHYKSEYQNRKDRERTFDLERFGYKVIRLRNEDTKKNYGDLAALVNRKYSNYVPSIYYHAPEIFLTKPPRGSVF